MLSDHSQAPTPACPQLKSLETTPISSAIPHPLMLFPSSQAVPPRSSKG